MKRILITGAAGFIGFHLAKALLYDKENALILIDDLSRGAVDDDFKRLQENPQVSFIHADVTDALVYKNIHEQIDQIYHLAAVNGTKAFYEKPHEVLRINITSLFHVLEWVKKLEHKPKVCFTSSNEAYAGALESFGVLPIPTPESVPLVVSDTYNPRWSYGGSKLIGELFMIHYARAYGIRGCIVRPHNFYGPRAGYGHVIPELSLKIAQRVDPFPLLSPDETRTFCYISDAVDAMVRLMNSPKTDAFPIETVHIGANDEISMHDLAQMMFSVASWSPTTIQQQPSLAGSVKRRQADISKITGLIGWKPTTSLRDGLQKTYVWYKQHPQP